VKIKKVHTNTTYKSYPTDSEGNHYGSGYASLAECSDAIKNSRYLSEDKHHVGSLIAKKVYADNARMPDNKEMIASYNVVAACKGGLTNVVTLRLYMGRSSQASKVYACLWVHGRDGFHPSGSGSAGGCGYCKQSFAAGNAIKSAGIELNKSVNGVGMPYVEDALKLIAKKAGYNGKSLIVRN